MRKTFLSMALAVLIGAPGAFAQSGGGSSTAVKNPSGRRRRRSAIASRARPMCQTRRTSTIRTIS